MSTGWNASGPPKATLPFAMPRFGGGTFHLTGVRSWFANTWNYVCGDGDQGLFAHVFLVLLRGETFAMASDSRNASATTYHVSHFFGGYKPWRSLNRCRAYFDFMNASDFRHAETACVRALDEKRRCLLDGLEPRRVRCRRKRQKSTCQMKAECPRGIGACFEGVGRRRSDRIVQRTRTQSARRRQPVDPATEGDLMRETETRTHTRWAGRMTPYSYGRR